MTIIWFLLCYFLLSLCATVLVWASCVAAKRGDTIRLQPKNELPEDMPNELQPRRTLVITKA